jgi:hypothetical protein
MDISQSGHARKPAQATARETTAGEPLLAARLAAIRTEIRALTSAPNVFGSVEPLRRQRDLLILQVFAADVFSRLSEARAAR